MGCAISAPPAWNRHKDVRHLRHECSLLLGVQHQIAVSLLHGCESGENAAAHAKIDRAHVRAFLGPVEAERDAAKVIGGHDVLSKKPGYMLEWHSSEEQNERLGASGLEGTAYVIGCTTA